MQYVVGGMILFTFVVCLISIVDVIRQLIKQK